MVKIYDLDESIGIPIRERNVIFTPRVGDKVKINEKLFFVKEVVFDIDENDIYVSVKRE